MLNFLLTVLLVSLSVAIVMEILKTLINKMGKAIAKKKGRDSKAFAVDSVAWWMLGGILSLSGAFFGCKAVLGSEELITGLLSILLSPYLLWVWVFVVWYVQMQLDMKVVKKIAVPIIKKLLEKNTGVKLDD